MDLSVKLKKDLGASWVLKSFYSLPLLSCPVSPNLSDRKK